MPLLEDFNNYNPLLRALTMRRRALTMAAARLGPPAMTEPVLAVLAALAASEACVEREWTPCAALAPAGAVKRADLADLAPPDYAAGVLEASCQGRWFLAHGQVVTIATRRPGRYGLGRCHANAGWLARRWPHRYVWWTGYALGPGGFLDNHSWVCRDGQHVEVTYDAPAPFYLGVPIPPAAMTCPVCTHPNDCTAFRALGQHP